MPTIDADAHVIETPATWSYLSEAEQAFRPQIFVRDPHDGAPYGANTRNQYWVVEGRLISKTNVGEDVPVDSREMSSVAARLDVLVLFRQDGAIAKYDKYRLQSPLTPVPIHLVDLRRYSLADGAYELEVTLTDPTDTTRSQRYGGKVELAYSGEGLEQSDLQLLAGVQNDVGRYSVVAAMQQVKLRQSPYAIDPIFAVFRFLE